MSTREHAAEVIAEAQNVPFPGPKQRKIAQALIDARIIPTQPAPAGVVDQETAHLAGGRAYAEGGGPDDVVDAVLAVLPTRTVAQVKAEAWDEGVKVALDDLVDDGLISAVLALNPYRADELEREDKR